MRPEDGTIQQVEVVTGGPLPRNGFVQPVEVIGGISPPGTWVFVQKGTTIVPNGSGDLHITTYTPSPGEILVALVSLDGATAGINIQNDNTNANPGVNDLHWNIRSDNAGGLMLHFRSGNQGGSTVRWALYTVVPP
jgi:hypothetical protein